MRISFFSFFVWVLSNPVVSADPKTGDELVQPSTIIDSVDGVLSTTLSLEYAKYRGAAIGYNTRLFNGEWPGPVYRLDAGDTLKIRYENNLDNRQDADNAFVSVWAFLQTLLDATVWPKNLLQYVEITNLHFHGGHVRGELPADDVRLRISPGEHFNYEAKFPDNHFPGTHWIHPHVHGSSSYQTAGGAQAVIIVKDPTEFLPTDIKDLTEYIMVVQDHAIAEVSGLKTYTRDSYFEILEGEDSNADAPDEFRTVNGQYQPTVTINGGEWYRFRIVFATYRAFSLDMYLSDGSTCEMQLLAKDGLYIRDFPRQITKARIPSGGRADIIFGCPDAGDHVLKDYFGNTLMTVTATTSASLTALSSWTPTFPSYLTDLRDVSVDDDCKCDTKLGISSAESTFSFEFVEFVLSYVFLFINPLNYIGQDVVALGNLVNGRAFNPREYIHIIKAGEVVERRLSGIEAHTYHQHVYPFEITSDLSKESKFPDDAKVYFKSGDWHDSFYVEGYYGEVKVRFPSDVHDGRVMVHCHNLVHEDRGMMAQELITSKKDCDCQSWEQTFDVENCWDVKQCGATGHYMRMGGLFCVDSCFSNIFIPFFKVFGWKCGTCSGGPFGL